VIVSVVGGVNAGSSPTGIAARDTQPLRIDAATNKMSIVLALNAFGPYLFVLIALFLFIRTLDVRRIGLTVSDIT
jgi:uncharacterized membrane protein (GlpM family)